MTAGAAAEAAAPSAEELERLVRLQLQAQALEELLERLSRRGSIGLDRPAGDARIAQIGAGLALEPDDVLFGTARDLPAAVARGLPLETALRQAFGVEGDPAMGRGMPGAIHDAERGIALSDGSPAAHLGHAAGWGFGARYRGADRVAVALFGSGAQAHGELHAGLNMAAVHRARTVFVARGPLAGERVFADDEGPSAAARAWGLEATAVAGDDGRAVRDAVREARERAVADDAPCVVEARLDGEARPVDAEALRDAGGWSLDRRESTLAELREALRTARREAEAASPIAPGTLVDELFAERPWFLEEWPEAPGGGEGPAGPEGAWAGSGGDVE